MRITTLTMRDFRCFRALTTIDLGADVVAIYGRNGSGKTTIFDAIEFALLGEIGRFASASQKLSSYVPNALEKALPSVRVNYINGASDWVEASLDANGSIALGPRWSSHRDFLYDCLVQDEYQTARREVNAVRELFRASVLLSQWSIRHFVEADASVRASFLAHIAGVPYLQRCLDKALEVQKLAKKREIEAGDESQVFSGELQGIANELAGKVARRKALLDRLGNKILSLEDLTRALSAAGLTLEPTLQSRNPEETKEAATALCREALADLDRRDRALAELELTAHGHRQRVDQRQQVVNDRETLHATAAELEKNESELSAAIASSQSRVGSTKKELDEILEEQLALDELARNRRQLANELDQLQSAITRRQELQNLLRKAQAGLEGLSAAALEADNRHLDLVRSRDSINSALDGLQNLQNSLPAYRSDVTNLRRSDRFLAEIEQEREALAGRIVRLQERHAVATQKLNAAEQIHNALNSAQQRKNSLVAALREYASGEQCPMCGIKHQTPQALADSIERQLQTASQDILDSAKEIEAERAELQRIESDLRIASENVARCETRLRTVSAERADLVSRISVLERLAEQGQTRMETEIISQDTLRLESRLRDVITNLRELSSEASQFVEEKDQLQSEISQYEREIAEQSRKHSAAQSAINRFQRRARELGFEDALPWTDEEIAKVQAEAESKRESLRMQQVENEGELARITQRWNSIRESRGKVSRDIDQCITTLVQLTDAIQRTERLCQQLGVPAYDPEEAVRTLRRDLTDLRRKLNSAATAVERYEWSYSVAALTDDEQRLQTRQYELAKKLTALDEQSFRLREAGQRTETWSETLRNEVTRIIERRIATHQPEILRLFKAMVPCPYLFDDITMQRSKIGVDLSLKYRDQVSAPAEPKFFLSEAQANVLALAIFLSFAGSQRWSRLQTILLDDPVQHLDDLDAVAFLDNLRAVALKRQKQVIVSTCDQNLYLLMIRKFRIIGKEGIHFRGISLLENGGNAPDVVYDVGGPGVSAAVA